LKTPDEEIRDARDAQRLLDDPVFKKAFNQLESAVIDKLRHVEISNIETQHELVLTLQLLGSLKGQFKTAIESGKMAEIQKEQSLAQKVRALTARVRG